MLRICHRDAGVGRDWSRGCGPQFDEGVSVLTVDIERRLADAAHCVPRGRRLLPHVADQHRRVRGTRRCRRPDASAWPSGTPEEIAATLAFLAGEFAALITAPRSPSASA